MNPSGLLGCRAEPGTLPAVAPAAAPLTYVVPYDTHGLTSRISHRVLSSSPTQAEWVATRALASAGLVTVTDKCMAQCHVSLAACGACLQMSVPDLFRMNELTAEQRKANELRDRQWQELLEARRRQVRYVGLSQGQGRV